MSGSPPPAPDSSLRPQPGSTNDLQVAAFDVDTRTERWRQDIDAYVVRSPVIAGGTVYVTGWEGWVYALDAMTGDERWRCATFGLIRDSPVLADGVLYVTSSDVAMFAIAAATGAELWHFPAGEVDVDPGGEGPAPAIGGTSIYVVLERTLHALDLS